MLPLFLLLFHVIQFPFDLSGMQSSLEAQNIFGHTNRVRTLLALADLMLLELLLNKEAVGNK
jgi:hypothetical protein